MGYLLYIKLGFFSLCIMYTSVPILSVLQLIVYSITLIVFSIFFHCCVRFLIKKDRKIP